MHLGPNCIDPSRHTVAAVRDSVLQNGTDTKTASKSMDIGGYISSNKVASVLGLSSQIRKRKPLNATCGIQPGDPFVFGWIERITKGKPTCLDPTK